MDKYLVEIPPKPPPLSATDALIIHGKVEKENNGNGEKPNKTSNSNCNNKSNKVKFNMTQNEVWEIEGVPSIEKENLWWTKYKFWQNKKKPKESQQQQADHEAFLADAEEAKLDAQQQAEIEAKEAQQRVEREAKLEAEREAEIEEDPFYDDDTSGLIDNDYRRGSILWWWRWNKKRTSPWSC